MPYKSEAQRRKFHSMLNEKKVSKEVVDEFDKSSKGKKLPERVGKKKVRSVDDLVEIRKSKFGK